MKKIFSILLIFTIILPIYVSADAFSIPETDITIDIDEEVWTIFTREDIKDKNLLKQYDIDYESINELFESNNLYLQGSAYVDEESNTIEFFIRKEKNKENVVLEKMSNNEVTNYFKDYASKNNIKSYDFYVNDYNNYMFYGSYNDELYAAEYYTIINGNDYFITFQTKVELTDEMITSLDSIIDGISFNNIEKQNLEKSERKDEIIVTISIILVITLFIVGKKYIKKKSK